MNESIQYAIRHGDALLEDQTLLEETLIEAMARPIAYHSVFRRITGKAVAAIMLSQAWYWMPRTKNESGWFWKTQEEWEEETGLSRDEQETARRTLIKKGFMQEDRRGIPAKMYYRVDSAAVALAIARLVQCTNLDCGNAPIKNGASLSDKNGAMHQSYNTEITTENTAENTFNSAEPEKTLSGETAPAALDWEEKTAEGTSFTVEIDTLDQHQGFLKYNAKMKAKARFDCRACGAKASIAQSDEVTKCCGGTLIWRNNPLWDKHQRQKATDEEAKRQRAQAVQTLTPGAKYLLTQAIATDPQHKCSYRPGESDRIAAFESDYGLDLIHDVTNEKMIEHVGRGLIFAAINALPFAARGRLKTEPPEPIGVFTPDMIKKF